MPLEPHVALQGGPQISLNHPFRLAPVSPGPPGQDKPGRTQSKILAFLKPRQAGDAGAPSQPPSAPHRHAPSESGRSPGRGRRECGQWGRRSCRGAHSGPLGAGSACPGCGAEDTVPFQCPSCNFHRCRACWRRLLQVGGGTLRTRPLRVCHLGGRELGSAGGDACAALPYLRRPLGLARPATPLPGSRASRRSSGQSPSEAGDPRAGGRRLCPRRSWGTCPFTGCGPRARPVPMGMPLKWQQDRRLPMRSPEVPLGSGEGLLKGTSSELYLAACLWVELQAFGCCGLSPGLEGGGNALLPPLWDLCVCTRAQWTCF